MTTAGPADLTQNAVCVLACRDCGTRQTLDPVFCRNCGSTALAWVKIGGNGRIYATTTIHRAPTPAFRPLVPYTLALVDLEGGARIMGHCAPGLAIGNAVHATICDAAGVTLMRFVSAGETR